MVTLSAYKGVHKVDDIGRVLIPSKIRKALQIQHGDSLTIELEGDHVTLKKAGEGIRCLICSSEMKESQGIETTKGNICDTCFEELTYYKNRR